MWLHYTDWTELIRVLLLPYSQFFDCPFGLLLWIIPFGYPPGLQLHSSQCFSKYLENANEMQRSLTAQ